MAPTDDSMAHVVTLRDIWDQGQATHNAVIRLEGKVEDTAKDIEAVKQDQRSSDKRLLSLELDRAKVYGMATLLAFLSSGITISIGAAVIYK